MLIDVESKKECRFLFHEIESVFTSEWIHISSDLRESHLSCCRRDARVACHTKPEGSSSSGKTGWRGELLTSLQVTMAWSTTVILYSLEVDKDTFLMLAMNKYSDASECGSSEIDMRAKEATRVRERTDKRRR